jgi:signal transduction histidine kinase
MSQRTETLLHTLAHELRQPLSTIESIAYYLQLALPQAEPRVADQIRRLRELVEQSGAMITDALTLEGSLGPVPEVVDLNELVTELALDAAQHDAARPQFDVRLEGLPVWIDYSHARHLVQSIGRILRSMSRQDARIEVETRVLASGSVVLRASAQSRGPEAMLSVTGSNLTMQCLERIAELNQGSLYWSLPPSGPLVLAVELPAAPRSAQPARNAAVTESPLPVA